jgi:DNA-binding NarL/FixJ family response regulator
MEIVARGLQTGVLVVEDNEHFSAFICSVLREHALLQVVGKACNGFDAVRQAELLRPELITMDIALPQLNGIAAARRIRQFLPEAKIIFLSQESSEEVIRECLKMGGCAYVRKLDAGHALSRAIEAITAGKQILRSLLECYDSTAV